MKQPLKIIFFGTSEFSTIVLDELKEAGIVPTLIVTAPDRPKGRKLVLTPPPVKVWAEEEGVDYMQPEKLSDEEFLESIKNTEWDLFIVASYGKLIPKHILDTPTHHTLNVHPSLLPKLRGASPIRGAILTDEKETGVSIMQLDEKMDHGPIVAQASVALEEWPPKASFLEELLAHEGGKLLAEAIPLWVKGDITPEEQDHDKATYTKILAKEDGLLDLDSDPYQNYLKIQALEGWPGTYFFIEKSGKKIRVKVVDAEFKNGELRITRIIPEGKKEMDYADFLRA